MDIRLLKKVIKKKKIENKKQTDLMKEFMDDNEYHAKMESLRSEVT